MEYTVENLERAVTLFYKSETGQQAEAHQWLTEAQNSHQAWSFVWELLDPRRSSEVQFFAATTLHMKLLKFWNEVPEDHYELLKNRILEAIIAYAMGPKLVLNRLCITLSAYIIHTVPQYWPNAFKELLNSFQPHHLPNVEPERVVWILLEILVVTPEEFQSTALASSKKARVRRVLVEATKDILKVIEMCLLPVRGASYSMSNLTTYLNSARCITSWIQLGGVTIEDCSHIMNMVVDLACFVYWNRAEADSLSAEEIELIEIALEALSSIMGHPQTHKYTKHIVRHTARIISEFGKILNREMNSSDPNKDVVANIYGLLVNISDTHAKLLIHNLKSNVPEEQKLTIDILNCILNCTNLPGMYPTDESSSSLTFGFWYTLQDDILSLDTVDCAEMLLVVKPYYRQLVCVMLHKSMYPGTWDDCTNLNWSTDDKEVFRCYRQDVADTFMYCYNVLNLEMLDILQSKLTQALTECNKTPAQHWNAVESCLHAFASVSECIELENLYLPKLMLTIRNIPYADLNIKVLATALDTIGAYSEWLADHPEVINNIIPMIISGLGNADVASNASMALKDVAHNCKKYLYPYAEHLLVACQTAMQNGQLRLAEHIRIMHTIGVILSVMPVNRIMEYLNVIVGSSVEDLQALVNSQNSDSTTTSIITRLKMLSALFSTLHVKSSASSESFQQPILLVAQNTLPLYLQIANKYCSNTEIMEVLCGLLKHTITTLMDDCKALIPSILQLLIATYVRVPLACILVLSKTILIMFCRNEELTGMLHQFLCEIVNTTLQMCAQFNDSNMLSEKADVIEAFFVLLAQVLKKCNHFIYKGQLDCALLFQCGVMCLTVPEVQTLKACGAFLVTFISNSRENEQAHIIQKCGENLIHKILLCLGGLAPRSSTDSLTDIIMILNKKYCDSLSCWFDSQLKQENFPSPLVLPPQKTHFAKMVLRERTNKRKLLEYVTEFTLICRGIIKPDVISSNSNLS